MCSAKRRTEFPREGFPGQRCRSRQHSTGGGSLGADLSNRIEFPQYETFSLDGAGQTVHCEVEYERWQSSTRRSRRQHEGKQNQTKAGVKPHIRNSAKHSNSLSLVFLRVKEFCFPRYCPISRSVASIRRREILILPGRACGSRSGENQSAASISAGSGVISPPA
jgi:hypothetical protein